MDTKKLWLVSLVGGLISTALSNIPIINLVNCLLCAGFWVGALVAVWMYKRQTGAVTLKQGIVIGVVTGVFAGVFGFLLSLFGMAGAEALMKSYAQFAPPDAKIDLPQPGIASVLFNLIGVGVNVVFGAIGGLVGGLIFQSKPAAPTTGL